LGLVEAVDLVEEEDRGLARGLAPVLGALEHGAHLGTARLDGTRLLEGRPGARRDDARQRRLPGARRPVEDHRMGVALLDRAPQRAALAAQGASPNGA